MLLHANFVPERLARRRRRQRLTRLGLVLVGALGLLALAPALGLQLLGSRQAEHLLALRRQRAALAAQVAQVKWYESELKRLSDARAIVAGAHQNDALWLDLLREVRDRLPAGVWLSRLAVTPADRGERARPGVGGAAAPPQTLTLEGLADGHAPISAYVAALNDSPWIETTALVRTGRQSITSAAEPPAATPAGTADAAEAAGQAAVRSTAPADPGEGPTAFELRAVLRHQLPPPAATAAPIAPTAPAAPPTVPLPPTAPSPAPPTVIPMPGATTSPGGAR